MAAPQDSSEQGFRLRKFQGTNTQVDSTFLGPSYLARSENWIPTQSFRLGKRPGSDRVQYLAGCKTASLLVAHSPTGGLYIYAYNLPFGASPAVIQQSIEEGVFTVNPPNASFPGRGHGRMVQFRDRIYAGNGIDPLVTWKIADPGANTIVFSAINDDGAPPAVTFNVDANAPVWVPTGTYAYAWARYNTVTGLYTGRTKFDPALVGTGSFTVPPQCTILTFPKPTIVGLQANEIWRLFISPRNFPVEYATLQMDQITAALPSGFPAGQVTLSRIDVTDTRVPMAGGTNVFRTGNMFVVWRNRVIFAGSQADRFSVFATDVILPGTEQSAFNQGTLFPAFAKVPLPAVVTGVGIAGVTTDQEATAPLLFFTATRTFLAQGDPFDPNDDTASLIEVSSRVGAIGHDSIVNTPLGTIFCGIDSVYLVPPGGGYPQDIGWPIADVIRQIPVAARQEVTAIFHKQFYKLAIPQPGGTTNSQQWWLDLRSGLGGTPSWWGPHLGVTISAHAADPNSSLEVDRGYATVDAANGSHLIATHQTTIYTDPDVRFDPTTTVDVPVKSVLRSGRFDADQPFLVKVFTRLRLICQTAVQSELVVNMMVDDATVTGIDPIPIGKGTSVGQFVHLTAGASGTPPPPNKCWNTAMFRTIAPVEVQTITPYSRPRGLSVVVELMHNPVNFAVSNVELRDFELLFLISDRKVRYVAGPRFPAEGISH